MKKLLMLLPLNPVSLIQQFPWLSLPNSKPQLSFQKARCTAHWTHAPLFPPQDPSLVSTTFFSPCKLRKSRFGVDDVDISVVLLGLPCLGLPTCKMRMTVLSVLYWEVLECCCVPSTIPGTETT